MDSDRYDSALLAILQSEGQIAKFLDVVMGFLYKRTDFYHVMKSRDDRLGFPPGVAPRLLIQAFEKYEKLSKERDLSKDSRKIIPARPEINDAEVKKPSEKCDSRPEKTKQEPTQSSSPVTSKDKDSQKVFQENPESHNGAIRDKYRWAQTITDCDLRVNVPPHIMKGKQVDVMVSRKHIKVRCLNEAGSWQTCVDSDLAWDINSEESIWSLVPKDCVHISMEKVVERWWENVFTDEAKISTQKIEATVDMNHLDEGAQSAVGKLMYDEHQKRLGLPTSEEQKVQDTLKKAWDAEGSPFKGTPYDPSLVNVSGQNT